MDPSNQWQPPQNPQGGYPPQQYPQQPPQYPQQPPAPPQYPQQQQPSQPYSAVPYATQPYSAPPAQPQPVYQQPPPPYQQPPAYQLQSGGGEPPRRNRWLIPLIVSGSVMVILVIAIVVVALNRKPETTTTTPQTGPSAAGFDRCLVGKWKQTTYQKLVDLAGTNVGDSNNIKKVKMTGGGTTWEIRADGSSVEDNSGTVYSGKDDQGRTITATWEGRTEWKLSTKDGIISQAGGEATTTVTISVDGAQKGRIQLEPNVDPHPYTCSGDIWRTTSAEKGNDDDFARYDRQK